MGNQPTAIKFNIEGMDMQSLCTLQSLHYEYPGIQSVSIYGDGTNDLRATDALSYFLSNCTCLQKMEIYYLLPESVLETLAHIPTLTYLRLRVLNKVPFTIPESPGFSSLRDLLLSGKSLAMMPAFIRTLSSPVEWMNVRIDKCVFEATQLSDLLESFHASLQHTHLTQIDIATHKNSTASDTFCDEQAITPLFSFMNLTHVIIALPLAFCLGNDVVKDMATAWPQLQQLELGSAGWRNKSKITPNGLLPVLCLPELFSLSLALDASSIDCDIETVRINPNAANSKLELLNLQDSPIVDSANMAALLSGFIPNVERITSWGDAVLRNTTSAVGEVNQYRNLWITVEHLIPIFAKVAKRERRAMAIASQY